jgi:carboxymethylenebutenolidase
MPGSMVEFPANGHMTSGYLALPPLGKGRGLLVIQEYWGLVPHITALTDRFANAGFVALAPDLYHGKATTSPDEANRLLMALNIAEAAADMRGAADFVLKHELVKSKKVGILGFCMGGMLALYAGMEYPDRFGAVVDFYGIHPKVKIIAMKVKVPVLGHFGTRDKSVPQVQVTKLVDAVNQAGGSFVAHSYYADHAFFNETRPAVYDKVNSELAWKRSVEFLKEKVKRIGLGTRHSISPTSSSRRASLPRRQGHKGCAINGSSSRTRSSSTGRGIRRGGRSTSRSRGAPSSRSRRRRCARRGGATSRGRRRRGKSIA